jgi:cyclomaltodextrinase / maltogenic alpha-amylase / neopullulanase
MHRSIPAFLLLLLFAAPAWADVVSEPLEGGARFRVTFRHQPVIAARSVHVAGSFNGWSPTATPLRDADGDGTFEATLELPRGPHSYKFVLNGDVWQHDGDNPVTEPDGHSGLNSVVDLGRSSAGTAGQRGDGRIDGEQLLHDTTQLCFAAAVDGRRRFVLRLHVLRDDVERVRVEANGETFPMRRLATVEGRDVYEARVTFDRAPARVRYRFYLEDGEEQARFPAGRERFTLSSAEAARFSTPDWVRDAVFYQVFPDRFRNADPSNDPTHLPRRPEGRPWHVDDRFVEDWDAEPSHFNFMGGDLAGVTEKADYIRGLGCNSLYLNPIFAAESNHRYDAADFETIDPALGDLSDFHDLRDAFDERGMRMVLDCVFNHTGDEHYAFQDVMQRGSESRYWGWYFVDGFPVAQDPPNYRCWWGFGDLPQLNTANPEVVRHLMGAGRYWLEQGAHGWRLDVPNEVDAVNPEFWPEFRQRIKRQDPEAYIVGEIWTDARAWLQGDKFDAVMNYPVRSAALEFLVKREGIDAPAFLTLLGQQLATYPEPALRVQFNLLGSHDTPRVRTLADGDSRRVRLAMSFVWAYLGAPVLYAGDEVGVLGGKDPECRRTYPWDHPERQEQTTLGHVRRLGELRAAEPALRRGYVHFLPSQGRVAAFARVPEQGEPGRTIVCVLHSADRTSTVRVPLGDLEVSSVGEDLLGGRQARLEDGCLVVELGPFEAAWVVVD